MAPVLVITPTLGRSAHLAEAIASVEPFADRVRHVLVCPGSQTATLRDCYPRLEIMRDDAAGVYAAINRGLCASGEWSSWTWLNDDDRWNREGMVHALSALESNQGTDVVYGRVAFVSATGRMLGQLPVASDPGKLCRLHAAGVAAVSQQGTLVRRALLQSVGPLDVRYRLAADFDWWCRAFRQGHSAAFINHRVADFRVRAEQLSQQRERMAAEVREIVRSNFGSRIAWRSRMSAWCFRLGRSGEILRRYRDTGCWRTSTLLAKHGGGSE